MNIYVVFTYFICFLLIIGKLFFTIFYYIKSEKILKDLKNNNEKKI